MRAFQGTWPKLEKWFDQKQNILVRVDADADEEELYKRLECVLQRAMMQIAKGQWSSLYYCQQFWFLSVLIIMFGRKRVRPEGSRSRPATLKSYIWLQKVPC